MPTEICAGATWFALNNTAAIADTAKIFDPSIYFPSSVLPG